MFLHGLIIISNNCDAVLLLDYFSAAKNKMKMLVLKVKSLGILLGVPSIALHFLPKTKPPIVSCWKSSKTPL